MASLRPSKIRSASGGFIGLTSGMRRVTGAERRARLGIRQSLAESTGTVDDAAASVIGLHASDPATVYLSARARVASFNSEDLEHALYVDRSLVRLWGMRRTLFVTSREIAAIMHAASPDAFGSAERGRFERLLAEHDKTPDAGAWIDHVQTRIIEELEAKQPRTNYGRSSRRCARR